MGIAYSIDFLTNMPATTAAKLDCVMVLFLRVLIFPLQSIAVRVFWMYTIGMVELSIDIRAKTPDMLMTFSRYHKLYG